MDTMGTMGHVDPMSSMGHVNPMSSTGAIAQEEEVGDAGGTLRGQKKG